MFKLFLKLNHNFLFKLGQSEMRAKHCPQQMAASVSHLPATKLSLLEQLSVGCRLMLRRFLSPTSQSSDKKAGKGGKIDLLVDFVQEGYFITEMVDNTEEPENWSVVRFHFTTSWSILHLRWWVGLFLRCLWPINAIEKLCKRYNKAPPKFSTWFK